MHLLEYLMADFVENSDFLKDKAETFKLREQHDARNVFVIAQQADLISVFLWEDFYCYCSEIIDISA